MTYNQSYQVQDKIDLLLEKVLSENPELCKKIIEESNKSKEYMKKYHKTPQYRVYAKQYIQKYHQTEAYKRYVQEYRKTEKWKEYQKAYQKTEKFKEYKKEYYQRKKGEKDEQKNG